MCIISAVVLQQVRRKPAKPPSLLPTRETYKVLEQYEENLARTILRGLGGGNAPRPSGL